MISFSIPSPSINGFHLGPFYVHFYALIILIALIIAWNFGLKRFIRKGGTQDQFEVVMFFTVIVGIIGARAYHVITDHQLYFGPGRNPWDALKIWNGGLGIWGAVGFGALGAAWICKKKNVSFADLADSVAPFILLGQGIGRLGNWFNQELYGGPTNLPWGLEISPAYRPTQLIDVATFHPTFLYELLWNLLGVALLLWAERKFRLTGGKLFVSYVAFYTFGRFWLELVRIDPANRFAGFRVNSYVSLVVFLAAVILLIVMVKKNRAEHSTESCQS